MNLVEYIAKAAPYLEEHGVASPRLNAELILGKVLGITRLEIYTGFERELDPRQAEEYRQLVMRRAQGVPLQYITGAAAFYGRDFDVSPGVFIPRPETEILVEAVLKELPEEAKVLDLCTGCGNIAVTIALEKQAAAVTAVDTGDSAVAACRKNALKFGVSDRVRVLAGDLYSALDDDDVYDAVVANPPYVAAGKLGALPVEVREHEPATALEAGEDGLDFIRAIVAGAPRRVARGGLLALEVDEDQPERVSRDILRGRTWEKVQVLNDLNKRPRVVMARLSK